MQQIIIFADIPKYDNRPSVNPGPGADDFRQAPTGRTSPWTPETSFKEEESSIEILTTTLPYGNGRLRTNVITVVRDIQHGNAEDGI